MTLAAGGRVELPRVPDTREVVLSGGCRYRVVLDCHGHGRSRGGQREGGGQLGQQSTTAERRIRFAEPRRDGTSQHLRAGVLDFVGDSTYGILISRSSEPRVQAGELRDNALIGIGRPEVGTVGNEVCDRAVVQLGEPGDTVVDLLAEARWP